MAPRHGRFSICRGGIHPSLQLRLYQHLNFSHPGRGRARPALHCISIAPLPFHTVGADSISARTPSPLRPTNPRVALLYFLYVRAVRGISPALKTAHRAVFAPRYADAGPGLFDSRTPLLLNMYNKKKKAQPLAKLSFLVTRASISRGLKNNPQDCFLPPAGGRPVRFLARKHKKNSPA